MSYPTRGRPGARVCTIIGFVFAGLAVLIYPVYFGFPAVLLGLAGGYLGDRPLGWYAAMAGVGGAVLGLLLTAAVISG